MQTKSMHKNHPKSGRPFRYPVTSRSPALLGLGNLIVVGLSFSLSACIARPDLGSPEDGTGGIDNVAGGGPSAGTGGEGVAGSGASTVSGGAGSGAAGGSVAGGGAFAPCEPIVCGDAPAIPQEACGDDRVSIHCQRPPGGANCEWYFECRPVAECNSRGGVCTLPDAVLPPNYAQINAECPGSADQCWVPLGGGEPSGQGGSTSAAGGADSGGAIGVGGQECAALGGLCTLPAVGGTPFPFRKVEASCPLPAEECWRNVSDVGGGPNGGGGGAAGGESGSSAGYGGCAGGENGGGSSAGYGGCAGGENGGGCGAELPTGGGVCDTGRDESGGYGGSTAGGGATCGGIANGGAIAGSETGGVANGGSAAGGESGGVENGGAIAGSETGGVANGGSSAGGN